MTFEPRLKEKGHSLILEEEFSRWRENHVPGSEMGMCLVGSRNSKEARVARAEQEVRSKMKKRASR